MSHLFYNNCSSVSWHGPFDSPCSLVVTRLQSAHFQAIYQVFLLSRFITLKMQPTNLRKMAHVIVLLSNAESWDEVDNKAENGQRTVKN